MRARQPKATLHRWLANLESAGLVQRTLDGRGYELGLRASRLAFSILANKSGSALRHEILQRVAKEVGETCNLTVLHGTQVTYLDRVESKWPLRITFQPGSNVPVYCSASGKLFLALMPPAKRKLILQELRLERLTENTLTDGEDLLEELAVIRKNQYALDREEFLTGLVCVATPVFQGVGRSRTCVAALALQAPIARISCDQMLAKLPILQSAARALASTLE
jgi:DNA-binding IclR family transcriptional regulator